MAYKALYREWRPMKFNEMVGQEHIKTTLKNQIMNNKAAHAYLFCGTRGTGKTTTAKIMAKALNCLDLIDGEPCDKCSMCTKINSGLAIDVTELDAASHNGVDKIREIIDDVQYPPQEARTKVYIMDEVHMLSMGAVNAFLKTLEEPPSNVVFILATTDPQKLPITVLSRCQRFDFKRISKNDIVGRLREIVDSKGVRADNRCLDLIARVSDGAMRDALSILDQAIAIGNDTVEYEELVSMLGLVNDEYLFDLMDAIVSKSIERAMGVIEEIVLSGKDLGLFTKDLILHCRNLLMIKVTKNPEEVLDMAQESINRLKEQAAKLRGEAIIRIIRILQESEDGSKFSKQARLYLELSIIKICKIEYDTSKEVILARVNKLEEAIKSGNIVVNQGVAGNGVAQKQASARAQSVAQKPKAIAVQIDGDLDTTVTVQEANKAWRDVLETLKSRRAMVVYLSLSPGKVGSCDNGVIKVEFEKSFSGNKLRLSQHETSKIVNTVFSEILNKKVQVIYEVHKEDDEVQNVEEHLKSLMGDALEIFEE
ncbi:DNA polymerase III subunit gamma/tau [uncultured Clostridium sp.]|uniref:DNA polymerase III subunit gamma/tau n=1 Tax=uncultured Clostridium sp. TaxID=59620 RepID=UPI002630E542|nr:DNA polymerase III subunit gamma/tau [uncultured Clostridium sp.]